MSFWASYRHRPGDLKAPLSPLPSKDARVVRIETFSPIIRQFLQDQFDSAAKGLQSTPPPFSVRDEFVVAYAPDGTLIGCGHVSTHPTLFEGQPVYPTDWLCVSPAHRKTGLTSRILSTGYSYLRQKGYHYCIYLKEGSPMRMATPPLYSSTYVFRKTRGGLKGAPLSPSLANRLLTQIRQVRPTTFVLYSEALPNQTWRLWRKGGSWILMGFQNAYQTFQKGAVGTLSAYFAIGPHTRDDFEAMIDSAPFDWIWADVAFVKDSQGWFTDGPFHWYAYQWSTDRVFSDQYCLMV